MTGYRRCVQRRLAEREGFEPPIRLPVCRISSAVLSTTQPPLRRGWSARGSMYPASSGQTGADVQDDGLWSPAALTSPCREALAEPADDQIGDLQVVPVQHQHVAVALVARLRQQQEFAGATCLFDGVHGGDAAVAA